MDELDYYERIDDYIRLRMNDVEIRYFESELFVNSKLKMDVELQRHLIESKRAADIVEFRQRVNYATNKVSIGHKGKPSQPDNNL